jgi:glucose-6-phosphate 1-dehydrogenase
MDPILTAWGRSSAPPDEYPAGSAGPRTARRILLPGDRWRAI